MSAYTNTAVRVALRELPAHLAAALVWLTWEGRGRREVAVETATLAHALGVSRDAAYRTLRRLEAAGWVALHLECDRRGRWSVAFDHPAFHADPHAASRRVPVRAPGPTRGVTPRTGPRDAASQSAWRRVPVRASRESLDLSPIGERERSRGPLRAVPGCVYCGGSGWWVHETAGEEEVEQCPNGCPGSEAV